MIPRRIQENLEQVRQRIDRAAVRAGRSAVEVKLVAVTKTFSIEAISAGLAAGQLCFGENRVQEAESKIRHFRDRPEIQSSPLEWHMIGHLQSNKARLAAELFDMVQSVDSIKLAGRLNDAAGGFQKRLPVLLQVDLGQEATKFGAAGDAVDALVEAIGGLPSLILQGLMTIPPFFENPDQARPFFSQLRDLRDRLQTRRPGCLGQGHLSMGMSHDFEIAIQEGATMVRIGSAIFGTRGDGD
jgi:pyridoxal phosphate enzyme (YggS family)